MERTVDRPPTGGSTARAHIYDNPLPSSRPSAEAAWKQLRARVGEGGNDAVSQPSANSFDLREQSATAHYPPAVSSSSLIAGNALRLSDFAESALKEALDKAGIETEGEESSQWEWPKHKEKGHTMDRDGVARPGPGRWMNDSTSCMFACLRAWQCLCLRVCMSLCLKIEVFAILPVPFSHFTGLPILPFGISACLPACMPACLRRVIAGA